MNEVEKREFARIKHGGLFNWNEFGRLIRHPGLDVGNGPYPPAFGFTGIDVKTKGYDGVHLPYPDNHFNTLHSSHCLEHLREPDLNLKEWFRVLAPGGHMIITVPHQELYEKKQFPPSQFNKDHKRFYTPWKLLHEIENALQGKPWRLIYCRDNDWDYDYTLPEKEHPRGCYEIECVIKKRKVS